MAASMIKKLLKPEIPTIYKNFFTNTNYIQKAFLQKLKKICGLKLSLGFMGVNYIHIWIVTKSIITLLH